MGTLILGLGNTVISDYGVGIHAARKARELAGDNSLDIKEATIAGFALLDLLDGYDRAVVIDATRIPGRELGTVGLCDAANHELTLHLIAGHQIDLETALDLGRRLGKLMPRDIHVVGVQICEERKFAEGCSPRVEAAIEPAARLALELALS